MSLNLERAQAVAERVSTDTLEALIRLLEASLAKEEGGIERAIADMTEEQVKQICEILQAGLVREG